MAKPTTGTRTSRAKRKPKLTPQFFVAKDTAGGMRYYWQPSAALRKEGWKPITLSTDLGAAINEAVEQNKEVARIRAGGDKPADAPAIVIRGTIDAIIDSYRRDINARVAQWKLPAGRRNPALGKPLAPTTADTYTAGLNIIESWASGFKEFPNGMPARLIKRDSVLRLRDALMAPVVEEVTDEHEACGKTRRGHRIDETGLECEHCGAEYIIQHHRAHNALKLGRQLFVHGIHAGLAEANPFDDFELGAPPPRDQIWEPEDVAAFLRMADRMGHGSVGFAVELAEYTGQRQADILKLHVSQWRAVRNLDEHDHDAIVAEDRRHGIFDGQPMGFFVRQGKTRKWVGIPVCGAVRLKVEAAIAINARRGVPTTSIVVSNETGRAYAGRWDFNREFRAVKRRTITPENRDIVVGIAPRPELSQLHFMDLRRTCVVRLGELGLEGQLVSAITGHSLETIDQIFEVYMPRTTKMAARGIVARIGRPADDRAGRERKA